MDLGISGETALLLSSTRGLGFGCAAALAAEGVHVIINGRNLKRGKDAVSKLGDRAHFIQADIRHPVERTRIFEEARSHFKTISILITNVESPSSGTFIEQEHQDWQAAFELLMLPTLDMVHKCLPNMIDQGFGRIVNISSTSAKEIKPGTPLSNGIKPGLLGALGTLTREVAATGVTVNSILPGPFNTDLMRQVAQKSIDQSKFSSEEAVQRLAGKERMKRWGSIEEFGALCAFLCSRLAGYITGQNIVIDGGKVPFLF